MIWGTPLALLLLLALPFIAWKMIRPGTSGSAVALYPDMELFGEKHHSMRTAMVALLPWLRIAAFALMIIALARPQVLSGARDITGTGVDIMLVLDISGSMRAEDFRPHNRFHVAREVMQDFISEAGANRLGLVIFAGKAFTQCPLTADHSIVAELLDKVYIGQLEDGTAIGMAIAAAANRLQHSPAKSKLMILLTDGQNNRGEIDPATAAEAAAALGIKIHVIGVGRPGGAPVPIADPVMGSRYMRDAEGNLLAAGLDEETLKDIAQRTNGQYFLATDAQTLRKIYQDIEKMEKTEYVGRRDREYTEVFPRFLWPGLMLWLMQWLLGATWLRKAP